MDPNITAMIETIKEQQKQFMEALSTITKAETVVQSASSPPKFESFDKSKEKWEQYLQRLQQHFVLHDIGSQERKRAFLLSCLAPDTYGLLQNLFGEDKVL